MTPSLLSFALQRPFTILKLNVILFCRPAFVCAPAWLRMAHTTVSAAEAANRREARPVSVREGREGGFMVGGTFVPPTGTYVSPARGNPNLIVIPAGRAEGEEGEIIESEDEEPRFGLFD